MKVSREIAELVPYVPGKPISEAKREFNLTTVIKLASNENALGPSPNVIKAITEAARESHLYPDPGCYELTHELSKRHQLDPNWMAVGNGSNELIDLVARVYSEPGECILTSQAAFVAYKICAQAARVRTVEVPLTANFQFDVDGLIEAEKRHRPRVVFLPNPNNPTGHYLNQTEMTRLLEVWADRRDLLIVIDEAYLEFVRASDYPKALDLLKKYENVAVLHTFSKVYGLAGLRVGVLYARPEITGYLHRVRNPFNVNALAQAAALAALQDQAYLEASRKMVWEGLDEIYQRLEELSLPYLPSQGNFVLFDTLRDADRVNGELLKKGVVLRPVKPYGFPRHLRMSVGLPKENRVALDCLADVLPGVAPLV